MLNTIAKIVEGFPFPHVSPIIGQQTYDSLAKLHLKLNANAESVQSNLGDGLLSLLFLTISPAMYDTLSEITFVPPVNSEATAIISPDVSGLNAATLSHFHQIELDLFNEYSKTDKALKQILLRTVDELYICSLRNKYVGYQSHTTRDILNHKYTTYKKISSTDLCNNDKAMKTAYETNQSIKLLIEQI